MCKRIGPNCTQEELDRVIPLPRPKFTFGVPFDPAILETYGEDRAFGYETAEDREWRYTWAQRKALLLQWVKRQMKKRLKPTERRSIKLCYFDGLSQREAARKLHLNNATVCRAVANGIATLRAAAFEQGISYINLPKPDHDDEAEDDVSD
jgi:hypothetical protein